LVDELMDRGLQVVPEVAFVARRLAQLGRRGHPELAEEAFAALGQLVVA
jgi:hypothetical protein